ncbi:hypothetical protein [Serratia marcescens]|uniref:hypothetical protein n=1 Tax=Serratia marcescens TaxID=615 RepID=UPI00320905FE
MDVLYSNFIKRCEGYKVRVDNLRDQRSSYDDWTFNRLTEGLMSDIWQNWCHFCRRLLHLSCRGGIALDKKVLSPRTALHDNSWQRIGYEAKNRGNRLSPNGHLRFEMRFEPTWGDIDNIIAIILQLDPNNKSVLLSAFGSGNKELNHLQLARNASAHKNAETMSKLRRDMILFYNFQKLKYPSDLAWSLSARTSTFAFYNWIYEMKLIARLAVRTC